MLTINILLLCRWRGGFFFGILELGDQNLELLKTRILQLGDKEPLFCNFTHTVNGKQV